MTDDSPDWPQRGSIQWTPVLRGEKDGQIVAKEPGTEARAHGDDPIEAIREYLDRLEEGKE